MRNPLLPTPPSAQGVRLAPAFGAAKQPGFVLQTPRPAPPAPAAAPVTQAASQPAFNAPALYELALTSMAMSFHTAAMENLRAVLAAQPRHAESWRQLATLLELAGSDAEADDARAKAAELGERAITWPPAMGERSPTKRAKAERKLEELLSHVPERDEAALLRDILFENPTDVVAMRLLARVEWRQEDGVTAQALLERALALVPSYTAARLDFARILYERKTVVRAAEQTAILLAGAPRDPVLRSLRADALLKTGGFSEALGLLESLIKDQPGNAAHWLSYAIALRHVGRRDDSVQAYRMCLQLAPTAGPAYSGLADLKGTHLTAADIAAMRGHLADATLPLLDRATMSYALASALERAGAYAESFAAYSEGAAAFRANIANTLDAHDPDVASERVRRVKRVFTPEILATRQTPRAQAPTATTPIFVVGMPRAGSTLMEQILASHSLVEGTKELPVMSEITRDLALRRMLVTPHAYPEFVLDMKAPELAALGHRFIADAAAYRQTNLPYFVDKRPWNWLDAGLIELILPHAKIIDIRRVPMAACFAMFKQLLPTDAAFSYDLQALGRYYNEYVNLMEYWDSVMPGRILSVSYERLVDDTEAEIRRILDYCGLPFEEGCLRFWETKRAVTTPSAEQVRRPIFKDAVEQWRHFEPWLGPLKDALAAPVTV